MNQEKGDGAAVVGCLGCGMSALAFPVIPLGLLLGLPLLGGTSWGKGFVAASLAAFILPMAVDRIGSTLVLLTVAHESGSGWVRRVLRIGLIAVSLALWPVWGLVVLSVLLSGGSLLRLFGTLILIGIVVAVVDFVLIAISGALASPTPAAEPSTGTLKPSGPTDLAAGMEHGAIADAEEDGGDADDSADEADDDFGDDTDFEDDDEFEEDEDFLDDDDLDEADEEAEDEDGIAESPGPVLTDEQRAMLFRIEQEAIARILAQRGVPPGSFVMTEAEGGSGGVRPKEGDGANPSGGGKKVEPSIVEKILADVKRREEQDAAAKARAIIDEERAKRGNGSGRS